MVTSQKIAVHQHFSQRIYQLAGIAMNQQNLVRIGKKPVMNYVTACVTLFNSGNSEVMVRARGKAIEKAVDTVQMLRHGFLKDVIIKKINLGTEEVTRFNGTRGNISIIEITLSREELDA
jgi:DNA-binding protein